MAGEWVEKRLGDVINLKRGYDLPAAERSPGIVPLVSSSGISDWIASAKVCGPGVVTGRYGTIGEVFYIDRDYWPLNTTLYVQDFKGNDPRFVSYLLRSINFLAYSDKGAVPGVNRNHLHEEPVRLPVDVAEQRRIAALLAAFDDRIDVNGRIGNTLEALASALFKSWFVDFDPVRAKVEGRATGLAPEVDRLFPDSFDDSEIGKVPNRWRVDALGTLCRRISMGPFGSDITTDNFVEAGVPVVRGGNLRSGFVDDRFVYVSEGKADDLRNANAFPGDIVVTHRGTLGQVGLIPMASKFPRYVVSQSQMLLSPDANVATSEFLFEFLRSSDGLYQLLANTSQTGVPAISRPTTSLKAIRVVVPPLETLRAFSKQVGGWSQRATQAVLESRAIEGIRDAVLPRLLSGEIGVDDHPGRLAV